MLKYIEQTSDMHLNRLGGEIYVCRKLRNLALLQGFIANPPFYERRRTELIGKYVSTEFKFDNFVLLKVDELPPTEAMEIEAKINEDYDLVL